VFRIVASETLEFDLGCYVVRFALVGRRCQQYRAQTVISQKTTFCTVVEEART